MIDCFQCSPLSEIFTYFNLLRSVTFDAVHIDPPLTSLREESMHPLPHGPPWHSVRNFSRPHLPPYYCFWTEGNEGSRSERKILQLYLAQLIYIIVCCQVMAYRETLVVFHDRLAGYSLFPFANRASLQHPCRGFVSCVACHDGISLVANKTPLTPWR